jgi:16S rRNA processing protein RimM
VPAGEAIPAGRVGRPHGLDGSFYVAHARPRLLRVGAQVILEGEHTARIARRAGTELRPIVRLAGIEDRAAVEALRGQALTVAREDAPELEEGEWWGGDLEGCAVVDGGRRIGVVRRLVELPSCEALEVPVEPAGRAPLLIPMVRDAIRSVDVEGRTIDIDMSFLGAGE